MTKSLYWFDNGQLEEAIMYEGVMGNLVAYACKLSLPRGYNGFVSFTAKTKLIEHYQ